MNFCVLLLCISSSGIYLKNSANRKEAIFYSLSKLYSEKIKNPSIDNQNKIAPLEAEFKGLLLKDYLEIREDWEIEKKVAYLGPPTKTLPPSILLVLDRFRKNPEEVEKFPNFKDIEAQLHIIMKYNLDSEIQAKPELFMSANKTAKKEKRRPTETTSLNGFLLILLIPLLYLFFKKRNLSKV